MDQLDAIFRELLSRARDAEVYKNTQTERGLRLCQESLREVRTLLDAAILKIQEIESDSDE